MAKNKMQAVKPTTDKGGDKSGFLAPAAQAGTFSSGKADTNGRQKPKK